MNSATQHSTRKRPCKFCQRSRWAITITMLLMLGSVAFLNIAGIGQ